MDLILHHNHVTNPFMFHDDNTLHALLSSKSTLYQESTTAIFSVHGVKKYLL